MNKRKFITLFLLLLFAAPVTLFAYRDRMVQTQREAEKQVIATQYQLRSVMGNSDFFSEDDYYRTAARVYAGALKRYPESVELGQRLQNLTFDRCGDNAVPEAERTALKDSLINYYKDLYEKNPKSAANIYLYARTLDDNERRLKLGDEILKLDKKSYWGHELKGWSLSALERYEEAEKSLRRATEIDSTIPDAYADLVTLYYETARPKELIGAALHAYELAPHPMLVVNEFWVARDKAEGLGDYESVLELDKARFHKRTEVEKDLLMDISYYAETLASTYRALGLPDSALLLLDYRLAYAASVSPKWESGVLFDKACLEASCGNTEKAIKLLEQSMEKGFTSYAYASTDSSLQSLRGDARFLGLVSQMKDAAKVEAGSNPLNAPAPDFTLVSFTGDTVSFSSLRGKPVILDFWLNCCAGAGAYTLKVLEEFQKSHPEIPVYGVGCDITDLPGVAGQFSKWGVKLPNLVCTPDVKDAYGIVGTPYILLIDSKGVMKYYNLGYGHGEASDQTLLDKLEWWLEIIE